MEPHRDQAIEEFESIAGKVRESNSVFVHLSVENDVTQYCAGRVTIVREQGHVMSYSVCALIFTGFCEKMQPSWA